MIMEYKYYRELKHNYLIVKKENADTAEERYQYRIAESGRIRGLIPCSLRSINGESYYYYEIGSMQPIRDRFGTSKMDHAQLTALLADLKNLLLELSDFLLGQEGLVFNAANIYTDLSSGSFKFMYCPFFDEEKSFSSFTMDLLSLVDEQDDKATDLIYRICEESTTREDFVYELLEECLRAEEEEDNKEQAVDAFGDFGTAEDFFSGDADAEEEDDVKAHGSRMKRAKRRLSGKAELLFSLMFGLLLAAMVYIRMNYILSSQENMLSILVMILSAITGGAALVCGFMDIKKARDESRTDAASGQGAGRGKDMVSTDDDFLEEDTEDFRIETEHVSFKRPAAGKSIRVTGSFSSEAPAFGETVVLDEVRTEGIALFSRNLDKTVRIPLEKLPLTIGKMAGCVDRALDDASVSMIHCRLERDADGIAVRDLGSTNGTFKNGERLRPQERAIIDEGDEIRIGRVCFDCR